MGIFINCSKWRLTMKIRSFDIFDREHVELTCTITSDHPASQFGQPVLSIQEWGGAAMDLHHWMLSRCEVIEIDDAEKPLFERWIKQFDRM